MAPTRLSDSIAPATVTLTASPTGSAPNTGPWVLAPGIYLAVVEISSTTPGVAPQSIAVEFVVVGEPGPPELFGPSVEIFEIEDSRCNLFGEDRLGTSFDINFHYRDPDGDVPITGSAIGGTWVFSPSGATGSISGSAIRRIIVGDRFNGTAETRQCYVFGSDEYVEVTMTLTDEAGNTGVLSPIRIDKPAGSN